MKKNEYNKWYLIIAIFAVIFTFFGGSLAYWQWTTNETERTSIALTVKEDFRCDADGGGDISNNEKYLVPTDCTNTDYAIQRTVTVTPTLFSNELGVDLDLWLNIDNIGTGLRNSNNFKYVLSTNSNSCTEGIVSEGTFKSKSNGSKVTLLDSKIYSETKTDTYYLYVWLDKAETSTSTMDQDFSISLGGECTAVVMENNSGYTETLLNGADPVLDGGMIPITLSNTGVATVADTSQEWYNYGEKEWANAVLVNENATSGTTGSYSREYYLNNPGTTVLESDILAYYVWIPRYKYQIWTTDATTTTSPQQINIVFEDKDTTKSNGNTVGQYLTHPAFTFGTNNELNGIWVGKFETTGDATTPTIKPNLQSLRRQNVSTQFTTSLKFSGGTMNASTGAVSFAGNNTYGLTNETDSHMMKNSEWGAVAYLSHSQFGINSEIYINNSSGFYTGRSGGNVGGSQNTLSAQFGSGSTSSRYNSYGYYTWTGQPISSSGTIGTVTDSTLGTKASTTGNITGIYDMSGGAYEYVMGNYNNTASDSGFKTFPESKYYNSYTITGNSSCTLATCGGQALYETSSWYSDSAYFVDSDFPWFLRGGSYLNGADAGAFHSSYNDGYFGKYSWRSSLLVAD